MLADVELTMLRIILHWLSDAGHDCAGKYKKLFQYLPLLLSSDSRDTLTDHGPEIILDFSLNKH